MKAVLMSIKKQWIENILDGKKTIEVRKTKTNLEVPFKVYIYCTKDNQHYDLYINEKSAREVYGNFSRLRAGQDEVVETVSGFNTFIAHGKVIGEFVCDKIEDFYCASVPYKKENNLGYGRFIDNGVYKVNGWIEGIVFERNDRYIDTMLNNNDFKEMCLSVQELFDYIGIGKYLYAWHISDLKIYDKPKDLNEFKTVCKDAYYSYEDWFCKDGYGSCAVRDKEKEYPYNEECIYFDCPSCGGESCGYEDFAYCLCNGLKPVIRPPQSWCYVEELQEEKK